MPSKKTKEAIEKIDAEAFRHFESSFPIETMGGIYGPFTQNFEKQSIANVSELSRIAYGKILWKWSGPPRELNQFGDLIKGLQKYDANKILKMWKGLQSGDPLDIAESLFDALDATWKALGSAGDMYENVPLVGIFIALAQYGVDSAKTLRKQLKAVNYPIEEVKMEYVHAHDQRVVNDVLGSLESDDWTPIFSPPVFTVPGAHGDARASAIVHSNVKWGSGVGQGVILTLQGGAGFPEDMPTGFGFHPQTARIPIAWQYHTGDPGKASRRRDWTYNKGLKNRVDSFEEFHPATQQLSVLLWQRLLKNTPEIYRVDAMGIRASWTTYFKGMEEYLTRKNDEKGQGNTAEFVRPMTKGVIERILSPEYWGNSEAVHVTSVKEEVGGYVVRWKILGKDVPLSYYSDPKKLGRKLNGKYYNWHWRGSDRNGRKGKEIATGNDWVYGVSGPRLTARGLTQFMIDQSLKPRQMNYLNTLTIAYLTPDMPAFRNWPELKAKFIKNRAILLKHQARIYVDLKRVPESAWKNQLKASLKGIPQGLKYTMMNPKLKALAQGDVVPGPKKKAGNPITLIPAGAIVKLRTKSSGGGGAGIAIVAAAALGVMVMSGKEK